MRDRVPKPNNSLRSLGFALLNPTSEAPQKPYRIAKIEYKTFQSQHQAVAFPADTLHGWCFVSCGSRIHSSKDLLIAIGCAIGCYMNHVCFDFFDSRYLFRSFLNFIYQCALFGNRGLCLYFYDAILSRYFNPNFYFP